MEFETRGLNVTVFESRPHRIDGDEPWTRLKVAQLRYHPESSKWSLHCRDLCSRVPAPSAR